MDDEKRMLESFSVALKKSEAERERSKQRSRKRYLDRGVFFLVEIPKHDFLFQGKSS